MENVEIVENEPANKKQKKEQVETEEFLEEHHLQLKEETMICIQQQNKLIEEWTIKMHQAVDESSAEMKEKLRKRIALFSDFGENLFELQKVKKGQSEKLEQMQKSTESFFSSLNKKETN